MNTAITIIINIKKMKNNILLMSSFLNANKAFHYFYGALNKHGVDFDNTKALFNVGFTIERPWLNTISDSKELIRNWKEDYAEAEWHWYLSGRRNVSKL